MTKRSMRKSDNRGEYRITIIPPLYAGHNYYTFYKIPILKQTTHFSDAEGYCNKQILYVRLLITILSVKISNNTDKQITTNIPERCT